MTDEQSKRLQELKEEDVLDLSDDAGWIIGEIEVLTFKVSNLTTERDVANQEIERWKGINDELNDDVDRLRDWNTAANAEIEKLKLRLDDQAKTIRQQRTDLTDTEEK